VEIIETETESESVGAAADFSCAPAAAAAASSTSFPDFHSPLRGFVTIVILSSRGKTRLK
jgi:hypothetical protein